MATLCTMPAFDPVNRPLEEKVDQPQTEETLEQQKEKEKIRQYVDERLKQLSPNDEMYFALEYFLLGDPDRQIEQLGDVETLVRNGDAAKTKSDDVKARYHYEAAAKIELYRRNKESVRRLLTLAQEVTYENDKHYVFQQTILDNLDEALRISDKYYREIPATDES